MRKYGKILIVLLCIFLLISCNQNIGGNNNDDDLNLDNTVDDNGEEQGGPLENGDIDEDGSSAEKEVGNYVFYYSFDNKYAYKGVYSTICVKLINSTDKEYSYFGKRSDFCAEPMIYYIENGERYEVEEIYRASIRPSEKQTDIVIAPGDGVELKYYFKIPADAPNGEYHLELSRGETIASFTDIFSVRDPSSGEDPGDFTFSYTLKSDSVVRGKGITIRARIQSKCDKEYIYIGASSSFEPYPMLYCIVDGKEYTITPKWNISTTDFGAFVILPGETSKRDCYLEIPADAPSGSYNLKLSYKNSERIFENVFTLE